MLNEEKDIEEGDLVDTYHNGGDSINGMLKEGIYKQSHDFQSGVVYGKDKRSKKEIPSKSAADRRDHPTIIKKMDPKPQLNRPRS